MHCSSLKRGKNFFVSDLRCTVCGASMPIPRSHRQREKGHIKHLYCIRCKCTTAHTESREFDFDTTA